MDIDTLSFLRCFNAREAFDFNGCVDVCRSIDGDLGVDVDQYPLMIDFL